MVRICYNFQKFLLRQHQLRRMEINLALMKMVLDVSKTNPKTNANKLGNL
jgi:hypothetical protein